MQTNSINFNNNAQVLNGSASRNGAAFAPGAVLVARIMEKNDMLTSLKTADGLSLNARAGSVSGAIGDEVRFEVVATADGPALRQIMEMKESFANTAVANADLQSLQDLMSKNDYYDKYLDERPQSEADRQLEYAIKANEAASRIKRALHRLTNLDSAIFGQLAAMGLNVDKIPTNFVDSVTGRMDSAISADTAAIVLRLEEMVDVICKIDTNKFARIIQKEGPLTLDDLYSAAHNNAIDTKKPIDDAAWAELVRHVNKFLADNEVEQSAENQDKARFLIERELPLDRENFGKLIFLSDIIANLDMETLVALTVDGVANGDSVGQTVAYEPSLDARLDGRTLSYQLEQAKARLEMSYQAAKNLYNADYPIDFSLQERAIAELTAAERGYLYNALEQAQAAPT
ncbi:MAG: DUF6240 domain-containing protein, partial [Defluviitaleaceae bacterium]|nr:DUF6240 domain-containing protein [Defluviitaleaceae bacterium]